MKTRDVKQVCFINERPYYTTYRLALFAGSMPGRRRKIWLGRNWRRIRPFVKLEGEFLMKSGTHDHSGQII